MIAYEIRDGVAVECPDYGARFRRSLDGPRTQLVRQSIFCTKRERRRLARMGTRGRRGAKAVPRRRPPPRYTPERVEVQRGHVLSDGHTDVRLYLHEGVELSAEHLRAVEMALRRKRT